METFFFSLGRKRINRVLMIVGIEMDSLLSLVKVSINETRMVWSISNFISGIIISGVSSLTSDLLVDASPEWVRLKLSLGVSTSVWALALTYVTLGWYILPIDAIVCLRYPFGFNNVSGSKTGVVFFSSRFFLVFFRSNASFVYDGVSRWKIK